MMKNEISTLFSPLFLSVFVVFSMTLFAAGYSTESSAKVTNTSPEYSVTVSAGGIDRNETIVSFSLYHDFEPGVYPMQNANGEIVNVQVDHKNKAWFILDDLPAGTSRTYVLDSKSVQNVPSRTSGVKKQIDHKTITFQSGDIKVLSYFHRDNQIPEGIDKNYQRGGYIHPVYTPGGVRLTNHLNPEAHTHHYGIWSAWTNTVFQGRTPDFWNIRNNTGRIDQEDSLKIAWDGPVHGGFRAKHHFVDLSANVPLVALNEQWEVYVYDVNREQGYLIFDLEVTQSANTAGPLHLPEYRYGGIGFRGHEDWNDVNNCFFLTSEGLGREEGHATRARWCHIGGYSEGNLAGITVMDHPENFRFPQPMRVNPNHPFFNYAPVQLGDMTIEAGTPYVTRHRYITYDGEPDPELIDRLWDDYAWPPGVTVTPLE